MGGALSIINMSLICDGSSDTCLQDVIQWLMDTNFPEVTFRVVAAREVIPVRAPLIERLQRTVDLYQPDLILCHRDAEAAGLQARRQEVSDAAIAVPVDVVAMVPVRMLESWLLIDELAIRRAASNGNGNVAITLPNPNRIEQLPDPKARLFALLNDASDLPPQRRRRFNVYQARSRVTSFMDSFAPLRQQQGFISFEQDFNAAISKLTVQ